MKFSICFSLFVVLINERLKVLSQRFKIGKLLVSRDPGTTAPQGVVISLYCGKYSVVMEGGSVVPASNFIESLLTAVKIIYTLDLEYDDNVKCVYGIVEEMCGISPPSVNIGNHAREILRTFA